MRQRPGLSRGLRCLLALLVVAYVLGALLVGFAVVILQRH
jgi:hypothetical protein